jgi:hypothetical protein
MQGNLDTIGQEVEGAMKTVTMGMIGVVQGLQECAKREEGSAIPISLV